MKWKRVHGEIARATSDSITQDRRTQNCTFMLAERLSRICRTTLHSRPCEYLHLCRTLSASESVLKTVPSAARGGLWCDCGCRFCQQADAVKVLFLEFDTERTWALASMGPAFLAAYLRSHGHHVEGIRISPDETAESCIGRIVAADPQLIGVSLTTRQWLRARQMIGRVSESVDVPVIAGGLHPTFSPEAVLASPGFDYVCLGEGEEALLELVQCLEAGLPTDGIRNIQIPDGPRPELRPPIGSLDALPFLARDLLDEKYGVVHIATQRGCPFPCTYCAARQFHDL
jgi:hypothetical protein